MTGIGGHFLHMWRNLVRRSGQRCIWYALSYFQPQNLIFDPQNLIFVVTKSHFLAQKWGAHCSILQRGDKLQNLRSLCHIWDIEIYKLIGDARMRV